MVEVKVDTMDVASLPKDLYVAVRVGEVQKLTKPTATKLFKFPESAAAERRYGRIDIFKRVGGGNMLIDPSMMDCEQQVVVPIKETSSNVQFRVNLAMPQKTAVGEDKPAAKNLEPKVKSAKEYLEKHSLEVRLSQAMQAVLRERPDDPATFVADILKSNAGMLTYIPKDNALAGGETKKADTVTASAEAMKQIEKKDEQKQAVNIQTKVDEKGDPEEASLKADFLMSMKAALLDYYNAERKMDSDDALDQAMELHEINPQLPDEKGDAFSGQYNISSDGISQVYVNKITQYAQYDCGRTIIYNPTADVSFRYLYHDAKDMKEAQAESFRQFRIIAKTAHPGCNWTDVTVRFSGKSKNEGSTEVLPHDQLAEALKILDAAHKAENNA